MGDTTFQRAINSHIQFHQGLFLTTAQEDSDCTYIYSNLIPDADWNNAILKNIENHTFKNIKKFFESKERDPAIYVTPFSLPKDCKKLIKRKGYEIEFVDSWMFFEGKIKHANIDVKLVESKEDQSAFLKLYDKIYGEDEVYEDVREELESIKKSFSNLNIKHYLTRNLDTPVGLITSISNEEFTGIYNLGVEPEFRKQGIGENLIMFCLETNKETICFLQTQKQGKNEKYFTKLGFKTQFVGECYVL